MGSVIEKKNPGLISSDKYNTKLYNLVIIVERNSELILDCVSHSFSHHYTNIYVYLTGTKR